MHLEHGNDAPSLQGVAGNVPTAIARCYALWQSYEVTARAQPVATSLIWHSEQIREFLPEPALSAMTRFLAPLGITSREGVEMTNSDWLNDIMGNSSYV